MSDIFLKSPMNYIGNKYRVLDQMLPLFPKSDTIIDLFAGGLDVSINYKAKNTYCNDINYHLIDIYKTFQEMGYDEVIAYLKQKIDNTSLSKTNEEAYVSFREYYNNSEKHPLDLYLLMNYSFNYQFRFNSNHEFNNPFGRNRSSFNDSLQKRLKPFIEELKSFSFSSCDFREYDFSILKSGDFVYCDPPYSLSTGSYNDGKRGFKAWTLQDDLDLMNILDTLSERGIKFAFSNIVEHKGNTHYELLKWAKKYNVHYISNKYDNCNYHTENKKFITREVLIVNE